MDFTYSAEDEAFRQEAREWIQANLPEGWGTDKEPLPNESEARFDIGIEWQRKLATKGWAAPTWPKEYGGGGLSFMQTVILDEELTAARAPGGGNGIAMGFAGPTILTSGTEEQKRRFVPKMINCDEIWCQGFSEPNAGSDLASLQTKAVVDGDDYVVNGQKVWSSGAHRADWQIMLVRTDPTAPKHRGITYLLVDMHSPGIEVRPLRQITGNAEFNEVFYDNVRVPRANVVGQENRGWYVAMTTLGYERTSGSSRGISMRQSLAELTELAMRTMRHGKPAIEDPAIRQRLAQLAIDTEIIVLNSYRILSSRIKGQAPGPEGQMSKVSYSELSVRMGETASLILGSDFAYSDGDREALRWQYSAFWAKGGTIYAGSSEIIRNIIGERVLGLPKG